jgi:hypothetical protein
MSLVLPDQKCVDLAKHFLPDAENDRVWSLALAFQEVAEEHSPAPSEIKIVADDTVPLGMMKIVHPDGRVEWVHCNFP